MAEVLIVSMYYWPEETGSAPYVADLAEHLVRTGHSVTVLAGMPHYPQWRVWDGYRGQRAITEEHAGVRIIRRSHFVPSHQSALRRLAYEASFARRFSLRLPAEPDAVIGVVPTLGGGVLARYLAGRARAGYALIVHDLVGAAVRQSGIAGGRGVYGPVRRIERWMLARAAVVAPVAAAFAPYLVELGVARDRIVVLPTWTRAAAPAADRPATRARLGWRDDEFVVLHAGNMGLKQGLEQVIAAARHEGQAGTRFVLMGDGSQRARLEALAAGAAQIEFRPFVAAADLPDVLGAADVLLVSERPSVRDMSLPSKLTSYFVSGRPVVAAVEPNGATADELRHAEAGLVVPAGDAGALLDALLEIRRNPAQARRWADNASRYARTALDRETILSNAAPLLERVLSATTELRAARH